MNGCLSKVIQASVLFGSLCMTVLQNDICSNVKWGSILATLSFIFTNSVLLFLLFSQNVQKYFHLQNKYFLGNTFAVKNKTKLWQYFHLFKINLLLIYFGNLLRHSHFVILFIQINTTFNILWDDSVKFSVICDA